MKELFRGKAPTSRCVPTARKMQPLPPPVLMRAMARRSGTRDIARGLTSRSLHLTSVEIEVRRRGPAGGLVTP
jgi:hypothetical protein